jgi:predicted phage terminase large subunit-like protein
MSKNVQVSGARIVEAACRMDFLSFFRRCFHTLMPGRAYEQDWHIEAMAYQLEQVRCGKTKRLSINISPRSLKSKMASVAFTAFILGHDPTKQIICISYGLDLASTLSNEFRTIVNSSWYQQLFPAMRISKNSEFEVVTTRGGYRLATSIDGSLTGRGADFIIIDDPLKSIDAHSSMREHVNNWYRESVRQRLNDMRTGAIIVVMQRLHVDDLTGMLLRLPEEWALLSLAAIAKHDEKIQIGDNNYHLRRFGEVLQPKRETVEALELLRSSLGPETFEAHYQQAPFPLEGAMIQRKWIRRYDEPPIRTSRSVILQSWDTALKDDELNDFSVCTTWSLQDEKRHLLDVLRGHFDPSMLRDLAISHARLHQTNVVLIEDAGVGSWLVKQLQKEGLPATAVRPQHGKKVRVFVQSDKFRSGLVWFPKHAPWLADLEAELFVFPNGGYDDQVDSVIQALAFEHVTSEYDLAVLGEGMGRLAEGLMFQKLFGSF